MKHAETARCGMWGVALAAALGAACGANAPPAEVVATPVQPSLVTSTPPPDSPPPCPDESPVLGDAVQDDGTSARVVKVLKVHPAVTKAYRIDVCYWGRWIRRRRRQLPSQPRGSHAVGESHSVPLAREPGPARALRAKRAGLRRREQAHEPPDSRGRRAGRFCASGPLSFGRRHAGQRLLQLARVQQDGFAAGGIWWGEVALLRGRMSAAMKIHEKLRPAAACATDTAERRTVECFEKARIVMRRLGEAPGGKPPLEDLAKCLVALKEERETPAGSPWAPMMLPSLEAFSEHVAKAPLSRGGPARRGHAGRSEHALREHRGESVPGHLPGRVTGGGGDADRSASSPSVRR